MEAVFDYFELLLGIALALTGFIVGRMNKVRSYESLLDRARREAVLRMKAEARGFAAGMIVNLKFQTFAVPGRRPGSTRMRYENPQEEQADTAALETVARAYGHVSGAERFFLTAQRIVALGALAKQRGWRAEGEITPIPAAVRAEIERRRQAR